MTSFIFVFYIFNYARVNRIIGPIASPGMLQPALVEVVSCFFCFFCFDIFQFTFVLLSCMVNWS